MNRLIDNLITLRILHILLQPIEKSDAFRLGVIDKNGKQLKAPKTEDEKDSFTILNKLAFKLKNIVNRSSQGEKDLHAIAASLHVVKECYETDAGQVDLEEMYVKTVRSDLSEDIAKIKKMIAVDEISSFESFISEDAPVNNASATPGIDGFTPDTVKVKKSKITKRKKVLPFNNF